MNIKEYLQSKYGVRNPTTMTSSEADAFGISYPLQKGWLDKHGMAEISDYMRERLSVRLEKRANKVAKPGRKISPYHKIGVSILKSGPVVVVKAPAKKSRTLPPRQYRGPHIDPNGPDFLTSYQWRTVRFDAIALYGNSCACCGATPAKGNGVVINVDHIKPRKTHPHLALDIDNLQVLCNVCNHGKSNRHETDFRSIALESDEAMTAYSMESINEVLQALK